MRMFQAVTTALSSSLLFLFLAACGPDVLMDAPDGGGADAAQGGAIAITIVSPPTASIFVRDFVGQNGALAARVELEVDASGPYSFVSFEIPGVQVLGDPGADRVLPAEFKLDGTYSIQATAFDGAGAVAATDTIEVIIEAPQAADCYDWLDLYGLEYTLGPIRAGVADPVTVTSPINGVAYRYVSSGAPRDEVFMDCELALALARTASSLRERDVIEVADIGIYNYRCIGGVGTPPDCPNGVSQHSYATAIDIAGYTTGDGAYYSVNDDWIIDPDGEGTCSAATEPGKDEFLHEVICQQKSEGIWNIVLTPNYNDAHRNHFHVDLSAGSDYIKSTAVDIGPDAH